MSDPASGAWRRALRVFRRVRDDVDDELAFHLEMRERELAALGLDPAEARAAAHARFGAVGDVRATCVTIGERRRRRVARGERLADLAHDLRVGLRVLGRERLSTAVALLCLALGIGATTTVLSVGDRLLLRPLPFPHGDELVTVRMQEDGPGVVAWPDYLDWRARQRTFAGLAAFTSDDATLGGELPERVLSARTTGNLFATLGRPLVAGRSFTAAEEAPGGAHVVVLSHGLAVRRFGTAAAAVGRPLDVNGVARTVVGVTHDDARLPEQAQLWLPFVPDGIAEDRGNRYLEVVGRLAPDAPVERARDDLARVSADLAREHPGTNATRRTEVRPLRARFAGSALRSFTAVSVAALCVLLIACVNVANLLLARGAARQGEVVLRSALGAGRGRLVRQLLTESVLLAVVGGLAGVALAVWGSRLVGTVVAGGAPPWMSFAVDLRVLGAAVLASVAVGVAFGMVPAWQASAPDLGAALRDGLRTTGGSRGQRALGRGLVVLQVALALVLLSGAGLAVQSAGRLQRTDPGFRPDSLLTVRLTLRGPRYEGAAERAAFVARLRERAGELPGVAGAAVTTHFPVRGCCSRYGFDVEGRTGDPENPLVATGSIVTPGYFRALGIPLLAGRDFAATDDAAAPRVIVVSQALARQIWPGEDPLGKRLVMGDLELGRVPWTVVGVAGEVRMNSLVEPPPPMFYRVHAQDPWETVTLVLRARGVPPGSLAGAARAAVAALDPALPPYHVRTAPEILADATKQARQYGLLFAALAGIALVLAVAGVYGVMAYHVARRTRELGVRLALGADGGRVLRLVLGQGVALAAAGAVVGLAGAAAVTRLLAAVLYDVRSVEPLTMGVAAGVVVVTTLLACAVPALRAARVDPVTALRSE